MEGCYTITLENTATGELITIPLSEFQRDFDNGEVYLIRERDYIPYLFGSTKEETARNMLREMKTAKYHNFWDIEDAEVCSTRWCISGPINGFQNLPLRLRLMLAVYNEYPYEKEIMVYHDNINDLHIYDLSQEQLMRDQILSINEEEKLILLEMMIESGVYNSNGFRLDGSHHEQTEEYPPIYDVPEMDFSDEDLSDTEVADE